MQTAKKLPDPVERRSSPRVSLGYQLEIETGGQSYWVIAMDMGLGGAFIQTGAPLRRGDTFTLSLNSLGASENTRARVVWGNRSGYGIAFIKPPGAFRNKLQELLGPLLNDSAGLEY